MFESFFLNRTDEDSLLDVVRQLDTALQYGEDIEVKAKDIEDGYDEINI